MSFDMENVIESISVSAHRRLRIRFVFFTIAAIDYNGEKKGYFQTATFTDLK